MTWEYTNTTTWIRQTISTIYNSTTTRNLGNYKKKNRYSKKNLTEYYINSFQASLAILGA